MIYSKIGIEIGRLLSRRSVSLSHKPGGAWVAFLSSSFWAKNHGGRTMGFFSPPPGAGFFAAPPRRPLFTGPTWEERLLLPDPRRDSFGFQPWFFRFSFRTIRSVSPEPAT